MSRATPQTRGGWREKITKIDAYIDTHMEALLIIAALLIFVAAFLYTGHGFVYRSEWIPQAPQGFLLNVTGVKP